MAPAMTTGGVEGPRATAEASLTPSSGSPPPPGLPRALFVAFALLLLALLAGGVSFYEIEHRRLRATAESELEVIGRLKVDEIAAWRADCLGDATVLMDNRFLGEGIAAYLSSPQPKVGESDTVALPLAPALRRLRRRLVGRCWRPRPVEPLRHDRSTARGGGGGPLARPRHTPARPGRPPLGPGLVASAPRRHRSDLRGRPCPDGSGRRHRSPEPGSTGSSSR